MLLERAKYMHTLEFLYDYEYADMSLRQIEIRAPLKLLALRCKSLSDPRLKMISQQLAKTLEELRLENCENITSEGL